MAGDTKDVGAIELVGAEQPHLELLKSLGDTREIEARILAQLRQEEQEIVRLDVDGIADLQWPKLRVQTIVLSCATAIAVTLNIGTASYPFFSAVGVISFPFPLVITRGLNINVTGAGAATMYLIGLPE